MTTKILLTETKQALGKQNNHIFRILKRPDLALKPDMTSEVQSPLEYDDNLFP
jgi:hypothetical protein